MQPYEILGHYPVYGDLQLGDPVCAHCRDTKGHGSICECCTEWVESEPIFADSESDTPTFCTICESLIPHGLTQEGISYIAELLAAPGLATKFRHMLTNYYGKVM